LQVGAAQVIRPLKTFCRRSKVAFKPLKRCLMPLQPPVSDHDFHQGSLDAPVVLVHYGDFECPYSRALNTTLKELQTRMGAQLCIVFRQFPLDDIHPHALQAALVAQAAGEKFWPMHDLLFENQDALEDADLMKYWAQIGNDAGEMKAIIEAPAIRDAVQLSIEGGQAAGAHGTPTVFINGQFHDNDEGLWKLSRLMPLIEEEFKR
jgi:protein-disulfide isomerase